MIRERLSRRALRGQYGNKNIMVSGPLFMALIMEGNKIRLRFDYGNGLVAEGGNPKEFTIAVPTRILFRQGR